MSGTREVGASVTSPSLVLLDPDSGLWRILALAQFLQDLDHCYRVSYETVHGVELFAVKDDELLSWDEGRPRLLLQGARVGSLWVELAEEFVPFATGAGAGAALVGLARMLRGGTSGFDQWLAFMARSRTHRIRALREEEEERLLRHETMQRLRRIETDAPDLDIEVRNVPGEK